MVARRVSQVRNGILPNGDGAVTARRWGIVAAAALLAACTSAGHGSPSLHRKGSGAHVSVVRLPKIVLRADLSEPPRRWHVVARIPYGPRASELGLVPSGRSSPLRLVPFAFAIGQDRSIWVLDAVKRRIAHYAADGHYLGAVHGFRFDRFHAHPRDMAFAGDRLVTLEPAAP